MKHLKSKIINFLCSDKKLRKMQSQLAKNWKTYMCYMYTLTRTNCEVCSLKFFFQGKCYDEIEVVSEGIGKHSTIFKTYNKVALIFTTKAK